MMGTLRVFVVVISLLLSVAVIADQFYYETAKLTASDGDVGDKLGYSTCISGDYIIVGAVGDDDGGSYAGAAYIFRRNGTGWIEEAKLTASDAAADDYFGNAVSISGDYAVIGASRDDDAGSNSGSAYIFQRNGTAWIQAAKLTASDGSSGDYFGGDMVATSGDYAVIGATGDDGATGSAYIFRFNGTTWTEEAKLIASDGGPGDNFGTGVSINGDCAVIGAQHADDVAVDSGSAYVFRRSGTTWTQEAKLIPSDSAAGDRFGRRTAISGDSAVVGANWDDGTTGSAYIFRFNGTTWTEEAKFTASDGTGGDHFGINVFIQGDSAYIGASHENGWAGSVYVFQRNGTTWTEEQKLTAIDAQGGDEFGISVSADGDYLAIGAYTWIHGPGSAYVFERRQKTVSTNLTCLPSSGTVPFNTILTVTLTNDWSGFARRVAARLDLNLANGQYFSKFRGGFTNIPAGESKQVILTENVPNDLSVIGENILTLNIEDVTPPPWNQPPYPPAGDTDTSSCTMTGIAP